MVMYKLIACHHSEHADANSNYNDAMPPGEVEGNVHTIAQLIMPLSSRHCANAATGLGDPIPWDCLQLVLNMFGMCTVYTCNDANHPYIACMQGDHMICLLRLKHQMQCTSQMAGVIVWLAVAFQR